MPITVSSRSHTIAEAYVLAAVVRSGGSLPAGSPLVLYAADKGDMAIAARVARGLALLAIAWSGGSQGWPAGSSHSDGKMFGRVEAPGGPRGSP